MPRINEQALKTELAKRGFESISIKRELPDGRVEVEANKLHPVHVIDEELSGSCRRGVPEPVAQAGAAD